MPHYCHLVSILSWSNEAVFLSSRALYWKVLVGLFCKMQYWCCREKIHFHISSPYGLKTVNRCMNNLSVLHTTHCMELIYFKFVSAWSCWFRGRTKSHKRCNVHALTIFVARFVDQTRLVCQQCIDLYDFSCQWRIQLTGCLHTFQSSKFICQRKRRGLLHLTSEILKKSSFVAYNN